MRKRSRSVSSERKDFYVSRKHRRDYSTSSDHNRRRSPNDSLRHRPRRSHHHENSGSSRRLCRHKRSCSSRRSRFLFSTSVMKKKNGAMDVIEQLDEEALIVYGDDSRKPEKVKNIHRPELLIR